MKKRLLLLVLLFFMIFSTQNIHAQTIKAKIPNFDVRINDILIDNEHSMYPLITYNNITYFPMTWNYSRSLGLSIKWDELEGLSVQKGPIAESINDTSDVKNDREGEYDVNVVDFNISVNGKTINNSEEEYPLLHFRNVTYFPLTWKYCVEEFNWKYSWNDEKGLSIKNSKTIWMEDLKKQNYYYKEYGNSHGNIMINGKSLKYIASWIVEDDKNVYMIYQDSDYKKSGIFSISKADLSSNNETIKAKKLIDGNCYYLLIYDGFLYFNINGTQTVGRLEISSGKYEELFDSKKYYYKLKQIYDGKILLTKNTDSTDSFMIYDINKKKSTKVDISEPKSVYDITMVEDWLYLNYIHIFDNDIDESKQGLYRQNIYTEEKERLTYSHTFEYIVENDKLYYTEWETDENNVQNQLIYRMSIDGSQKELIYRSNNNIKSFSIYGNTIVVTENFGYMYAINIDTKDYYEIIKPYGYIYDDQLIVNYLFHIEKTGNLSDKIIVVDIDSGKNLQMQFNQTEDSVEVLLTDLLK